jgi:hypothetical protein
MATLAAFSILFIWATMAIIPPAGPRSTDMNGFVIPRFRRLFNAMMKPYGKWRVKPHDDSRPRDTDQAARMMTNCAPNCFSSSK